MSIAQEPKQRKPHQAKFQTLAARRDRDRLRRVQNQPHLRARARLRRQLRFRCLVVRFYRALRRQCSERRAAEMTLAHWRPRLEWHFPLCLSSIRQWHRRVTRAGWGALRPLSTRPHTVQPQVPSHLELLICALRQLYGWGGQRLRAELQSRGLGRVSHTTIYQIFARHGLAVKGYALRGKADGIAYTRYQRTRPNAQWHIDFKQTALVDGTPVYIAVILDDYSRYALAAVATLARSSEWAGTVVTQAIQRAGHPAELVSDNGREFVSNWTASLTAFGQILAEQGVPHRTSAPYYPQGNGKVEAFNKTLGRELLSRRAFADLAAVQAALDEYVSYYNNYRLHSALGWRAPVEYYSGRVVAVQGLGGLGALSEPNYQLSTVPAMCDPPLAITPDTVQRFRALQRGAADPRQVA